jgi:hypothetical protein
VRRFSRFAVACGLTVAALVAGCEVFPVSDGNLAYDFRTTQSTYAISDTVRASFHSRSLELVDQA